jgi:hypothetical protein
VKLGDDYRYPIKGVGEASFKLDSGKLMKRKYFLLVPGLRKNLFSISSLEEQGFIISFVDGEIIMCPKGKSSNDAIMIGVQEGGLYKFKGHSETTLVHNTVNPCQLWHKRLSHIHYKSLPIMKTMVIGLLDIQVDHEGICKGYAEGKSVKRPFPRSERKDKGVLDIIHSDVCGPMSTYSYNGYVYYVSFIYEFSRKAWIYLLKTKGDLFKEFKTFI